VREQICIQLACKHLDVTEVGKMAALLVEEFETVSAKRRGSVAGGNTTAASRKEGNVRARLFEGADGGAGDEMDADLDTDCDVMNARIAKCIKSLQQLCRQHALFCSVALVCACTRILCACTRILNGRPPVPEHLNLCFVSVLCARSQLLEDEAPDYAAMVAEIIYTLQGPLSLEVAASPHCSALRSRSMWVMLTCTERYLD